LVKEVILKNVSEVPAKFRVERIKDDGFEDTSFMVDELSGEIPSKASFLLKISYSPMIWDLSSCTHFKVICEGGNNITVQCTGQSKGIDIKASSTFVNFGEVKLGSTTNRMLTINNESEISGVFEVAMDDQNIFSAEKTTGVIKPKSYARVLLHFRPQKTINYYQRIYILVRNHKVLYLDLIGNCYD